MKKFVLLLPAFLWMAGTLFAQNLMSTFRSNLPEVLICGDVSLHFISPEPITYVDISSPRIAGDLPVKNVLRVKIIPDSLRRLTSTQQVTVITIVGESFIAQYQLRLTASSDVPGICTQINILPEQMRPVDISGVSLTTPQLKENALAMISDHRHRDIRKAEAYGIKARLNHIGTIGEFIFLDLSYSNETELPYDTDELSFKIEDKKITKATNAQSVELRPIWQLYPLTGFQRNYRNIYVLKKASFPQNKLLNIELTEKQISGRKLTLQVKYGDILKADTF